MERVELRAQSRSIRGKKVKQLRAQGFTPAVVYGPDTPAQPIQAPERDLTRALQQASTTALINLWIDQESNPKVVLARSIQRDILTAQVHHVDFYQVRLTEKVKTLPRLEFVGESPLAKSGTAVVVYSMTEIEVECLPDDLISSIEVDLSGLETLDDNVTVGDLPVPEGITFTASPDEVVVSVVPVRIAEEEEEEEFPAYEETFFEAEGLQEEDSED